MKPAMILDYDRVLARDLVELLWAIDDEHFAAGRPVDEVPGMRFLNAECEQVKGLASSTRAAAL